ncbi:uncharacterized protein F5Z01DRAFT_168452 [Emericellopsis atlantica]|uniref:Zn(2)-C6 fungal-type domain-containing protein n=1 Tax=Emericellopsis atlantica TaxID=2614577 RepID=A0A9P8CN98_9HYPO|nr:uncharacterized protein F5Z01DRAFT_168452 [Emericellopsis atlantica]KAG9252927.1 hypothetical protein F5Z01DRAFT_168452 [Emericellopsis atlantica]
MSDDLQSPAKGSETSLTPAVESGRKTQSCAECRRRRIRCSGRVVPCSQCVYYQVTDRCHYPPRRTRQAPSAKAYAELSTAHEIAQGILDRLFPGYSLDRLQSQSRQQLIDLLDKQATPPTVPHQPTPATCDSQATSILDLEPSPYEEFAWDESSHGKLQELQCEDDVNGMSSLFEAGGHSYLGISSVPTILRVMSHTCLELRQAVECTRSTRMAGVPPVAVGSSTLPPTFDETLLIDAYFRNVHAITPMLDEIGFRQCRAQGGGVGKARGPWLALLNMVLTLGYLALNDDGQDGHVFFYKRASEYLDISCFAAGHLYTLQALILFGGYYLHYLNKPNMASAVMGAAHRMALAMGLHRLPQTRSVATEDHLAMESRTRTWWCLFL